MRVRARIRTRVSAMLGAVVLSVVGGCAWRAIGAHAASVSDQPARAAARRTLGSNPPLRLLARARRLLSLCGTFETITPCTASTTVYVGSTDTVVFEIDNNGSMDDIF